MPITDLTGYTWVGNSVISLESSVSYNINFISNNTSYTELYMWLRVPIGGELQYRPFNVVAYDFNTQWQNDAYKTIQITGGTDATNSTLISWLEANGTLTAPQPQPSSKISVGSDLMTQSFVGSNDVTKMILNGTTIYEKT